MPTTKVSDLQVLAIYVTDLERSEDFYRDHLGFEKVQDMPPGILMKAGNVMIYLEANRSMPCPDSQLHAEFSPCFATDSVKASHDALDAVGVRIASPYQEFGPSFGLFRIFDPDGNLIEFAGTP